MWLQDFIVRDRAGESVDRSEVHSILELFVVMGVCLSKDDFKDRKEVESVTQLAERGTASVTLKEGDVYVVDFEAPFLAVSAEWYRSLGNAWAELPSSEYAARVEECIRAEEERVRVMMHVETRAKLMATLTANMIAPHVNVILNKEGSGVVALLKRGEASFADIAAIYRVRLGRLLQVLCQLACIACIAYVCECECSLRFAPHFAHSLCL